MNWDAAFMADCFGDWRDDISYKRANPSETQAIWVQPHLLEALLDRIESLETQPLPQSEKQP